MENRAFRKFEWSVWKLLDWKILHQISKGFWEPWATPKPPAVSNEPPTENFCLRACLIMDTLMLSRKFLRPITLVRAPMFLVLLLLCDGEGDHLVISICMILLSICDMTPYSAQIFLIYWINDNFPFIYVFLACVKTKKVVRSLGG